jgi:aspartate/tyrosine/aromatic aminotransferase
MDVIRHTNKDIKKHQRKFAYMHIQGGSYFSRCFTALLFTATDAPLAAKCIQILPMNQYACGQ